MFVLTVVANCRLRRFLMALDACTDGRSCVPRDCEEGKELQPFEAVGMSNEEDPRRLLRQDFLQGGQGCLADSAGC